MSEQSVQLSNREKAVTKVDFQAVAEEDLSSLSPRSKKVWLRIDGDFRADGRGGGRDAANFFYSLDGETWKHIGCNAPCLRGSRHCVSSSLLRDCVETHSLLAVAPTSDQ